MRRSLLALVLLPPLGLALPFAGCGGGSDQPVDAGQETSTGEEGGPIDDASDDLSFTSDAPPDAHCRIDDADPVGLCVQKAALESLHLHAFHGTTGATSSWNYVTGTADPSEGGAVAFTVDDTVAYGAAASNYLSSAAVYGDTTINATLAADLTAIALLLESNALAPSATEYSGEYYTRLRTMAQGLRSIGLTTDATHVDTLANDYGRAIFTSHYFPLGLEAPDAGPVIDAGTHDAGGPSDARPPQDGALHDGASADGASHDATLADAAHDAQPHVDATVDGGKSKDSGGGTHPDAAVICPKIDAGAASGDGIFGNRIAGGGIAYAPADVATAAYALLDLVSRNPTDCAVPQWLAAVRASLNHLAARAREPSTHMYYQALVAGAGSEGGGTDALAASGNPSYPSDALLADTQATVALALIRSQYTVTSGTSEIDAGQFNSDGGVFDAGVTGAFNPILDFHFQAFGEEAIAAMNGPHTLWDGPVTCPSGAEAGTSACKGIAGSGAGYMDGYIPSTKTLITTKSTRPNAFMAGVIYRAIQPFGETLPTPYDWQLPTLVPLLIAQVSISVPANSNLITVVANQQAFFQTVSKAFALLDAGPDPASYTTGAVGAAVEGLTEQLFGRSP